MSETAPLCQTPNECAYNSWLFLLLFVNHAIHNPAVKAFVLFRCSVLGAPSRRLVAAFPLLLDVAEALLDLVDDFGVARVLADVVADFDGGLAAGGGDFDDDVEGGGFFVGGGVQEVV